MKNKTEILKSVNGVTSKAVMKLKKHSPEILVVAGIAGTVVSAVLACKATTKVAEILDETKGTLDTIHEGMLVTESLPTMKMKSSRISRTRLARTLLNISESMRMIRSLFVTIA